MDTLSETFAALAHPTRRAILERLGRGQSSVQGLIDQLNVRGPAMTKHLIVLERCGLIRRSRAAQSRPCHLQAGSIDGAMDWMEQVRRATDAQLDRMEAYLKTLAASGARTSGRATGRSAVRSAGKPARKPGR